MIGRAQADGSNAVGKNAHAHTLDIDITGARHANLMNSHLMASQDIMDNDTDMPLVLRIYPSFSREIILHLPFISYFRKILSIIILTEINVDSNSFGSN